MFMLRVGSGREETFLTRHTCGFLRADFGVRIFVCRFSCGFCVQIFVQIFVCGFLLTAQQIPGKVVVAEMPQPLILYLLLGLSLKSTPMLSLLFLCSAGKKSNISLNILGRISRPLPAVIPALTPRWPGVKELLPAEGREACWRGRPGSVLEELRTAKVWGASVAPILSETS